MQDYVIPVFKIADIDWRALNYDGSWVALFREKRAVESVPFDISDLPDDLHRAELMAMGYVQYECAFGHRELSLSFSWANESSEIRVKLCGIKSRGRKPYEKELIIPCMPVRTWSEAALYVYPWFAKGEGKIEYDLVPFTSISIGVGGNPPYVRYEPHLIVLAALAWQDLGLRRSARVLSEGKWQEFLLVEELTEDGKWYGWYRRAENGRLESTDLYLAGQNMLDAWHHLLAVYAGCPVE